MIPIRKKYEIETGAKAIYQDSGGAARFNYDYILWLEKEAAPESVQADFCPGTKNCRLYNLGEYGCGKICPAYPPKPTDK